MKRRSIISLSLLAAVAVAVMIFAPWGDRNADAVGTGAGISLTNIAVVNWNTTLSTTNTDVSAKVETNYGGSWLGTNKNASVSAGSSLAHVTYLVNEGNITADYGIQYVMNAQTTNVTGWSISFTNVEPGGTNGAPIIITSVAPGDVKQLNMLIGVPSGASNGSYIKYNCFASNITAFAATGGQAKATNYTGLNGIHYGGRIGQWLRPTGGTGLGLVMLSSNTNTAFTGDPFLTNWMVTAVAAVMELTKTITIENPAPFAANTTTAYPGARVTFQLSFTNTGNGTATGVVIIDQFITNYMTFVAGSLKTNFVDANDIATNASSFTATATVTAGDDAAAYTNDNQVFFSPMAGLAPAGGSVASGDYGSVFYQATLN